MRNFNPTANFFNLLSFRIKKSCSKIVKLHFYISREFSSKIECCVYMMHREISESFSDYTIFICKFKTDKCFLFIKRL